MSIKKGWKKYNLSEILNDSDLLIEGENLYLRQL